MKQLKNNRLVSLYVVFVFLVSILAPAQAQAVGQIVQMVALGDSLAAGQLPKTADGIVTRDKGYSGIMAETFEKNGVLASYSNKFAESGYTTQEVLDDITKNKEIDRIKVKDSLAAANVVTVTAGANDILNILKEEKIDLQNGQITDAIKQRIGVAIFKVNLNLTSILKEIKLVNPKAEIYVSGYYNPFPYLSEAQQNQIKLLLSSLNDSIKAAVDNNGATFVPLVGLFDTNKEKYLPNPLDIHPSLDGYQLIANEFIKSYNKKINLQFDDLSEKTSGYNEIKFLVENKLMTGISATKFGPKQAITRADAAIAIMNVRPYQKLLPPDPGFSDVPKSHPAYFAIAYLTHAGVFMKTDKFNLNAPLTRGQMAKVLTLSFGLSPTERSNFKDVKTNDPVKPYVDALLSAKITTGYPDNTFKPNAQTTRAQFAQFLVRASANMK